MSPENMVKNRRKSHPVKKTFQVIGTTLVSLFLIIIITMSIVVTAFTVYVMKFMDSTPEIDLDNVQLKSTTFIYAYDKDGNEVEIKRLSKDENRVIISLDQVPQHVRDAFIYREDERFYDHSGVDFKRTFAAFANMFLHFYDNEFGGSTITQQLVKNITGDDARDPSRKIREIFTAMKLEKTYTKDKILEAYLNYIGFGGTTYGVEAASQKYFGKSVNEITVAQAASLAAIPKNPNITPFTNPEKNKKLQEFVLGQMLDNGAISQDEYETALDEDLHIVGQDQTEEEEEKPSEVQSYFVDMVIDDVTKEFMDLYGIDDYNTAYTKLADGGYKIYSTVDIDMQKEVEEKFRDSKTFSSETLSNPPQAAFICMDYNGNIKAVVGGVGEKPGPMCFNRAVGSVRSPGSCIKPISTYGYGLSMDLYHWSSVVNDSPLQIKDNGKDMLWPNNYSNTWSMENMFIHYALLRSLNTVPAHLCQLETPKAVYDFMKNNMKISTLVDSMESNGKIYSDVNLAPLTVGSLSKGVTLKELVSAYQSFGNLGKIYEPTSYTKVIDSEGKTILEHQYLPTQAIDKDTAYVMNKLLANVVKVGGTGVAAALKNTPLVGKTGTSEDWVDMSFVGCTPDYVSGIWYGYDEPNRYDEKLKKWVPNEARNTYYSSSQVWKNVFGDIAEAEEGKAFPENPNIKEKYYCTITGKLASANCPRSATPGYYKPSNIPDYCDGNHTGTNVIGFKKSFGGQTASETTSEVTQTVTSPESYVSDTENNDIPATSDITTQNTETITVFPGFMEDDE